MPWLPFVASGCVFIPYVWYCFQWVGYLFGNNSQVSTINRTDECFARDRIGDIACLGNPVALKSMVFNWLIKYQNQCYVGSCWELLALFEEL